MNDIYIIKSFSNCQITYHFPIGMINFPKAIIKWVKIPISSPAEELRNVTIKVTKNGIRSQGAA